MSFTEAVKYYNVSTLLLAHLLDSFLPPIKHKYQDLRFPFLQLCALHGFKQAYIGLNEPPEEIDRVYLLFDKELVKSKMNHQVDLSYYAMNEFLVCSDMFIDVPWQNETERIYEMSLPDVFKEDYELILKSEYHKISKPYREKLKVRDITIPKVTTRLGTVIQNNLPAKICLRDPKLRKEIKAVFGDPGTDTEYFIKFDLKKEVFYEVTGEVRSVNLQSEDNG